jgi:hypothetical protein
MSDIGKIIHKKVKRNEQYALMASIAVWVEDNQDLVKLAQNLSQKTLSLGLCDSGLHHPFQIVPQDMFSERDTLYHDIFLNIDHAAWGYFRLNIKSLNEMQIVAPKISMWPENTLRSEEEANEFIEALAATLDDLYSLDESAEARSWDDINSKLEKMVNEYRNKIDPELKQIIDYVKSVPNALITEPNSGTSQLAKDSPYRFDLALLHPENWSIKDNNNNDELENFREALRKFFTFENSHAAFLYAAQKLLVQHGYKVQVVTDSAEGEPDTTDFAVMADVGGMVYVRPVLHATSIVITDGPKPKKKQKPQDFGLIME